MLPHCNPCFVTIVHAAAWPRRGHPASESAPAPERSKQRAHRIVRLRERAPRLRPSPPGEEELPRKRQGATVGTPTTGNTSEPVLKYGSGLDVPNYIIFLMYHVQVSPNVQHMLCCDVVSCVNYVLVTRGTPPHHAIHIRERPPFGWSPPLSEPGPISQPSHRMPRPADHSGDQWLHWKTGHGGHQVAKDPWGHIPAITAPSHSQHPPQRAQFVVFSMKVDYLKVEVTKVLAQTTQNRYKVAQKCKIKLTKLITGEHRTLNPLSIHSLSQIWQYRRIHYQYLGEALCYDLEVASIGRLKKSLKGV